MTLDTRAIKSALNFPEFLRSRYGVDFLNRQATCLFAERHTHGDAHPSMRLSKDGRSVKCFAGDHFTGWADCFQVVMCKEGVTFLEAKRICANFVGLNGDGRKSHSRSITLDALALDKAIPAKFLEDHCVLQTLSRGRGVGIPYLDEAGNVAQMKKRTALAAKDGSWWPKGAPLMVYGLWMLPMMRKSGSPRLILCEGESDCWTLWFHKFPALGIPGASAAGVLELSHVKDFSQLFVIQEPDPAGAQFVLDIKKRVRQIGWGGELFVTQLEGAKDPNDLHKQDPTHFKERFHEALKKAMPLQDVAPHITPSADTAHLHTPTGLAQDPNILARFAQAVWMHGVVGEERCAKLLYLALTSRVLMEPVSLAIKGLSSSGKSYTTETTLRFFPKTAYIAMTAMSERALIYMKEDFAHRTLVIFEAVALREQREKTEGNLTAYFVRSLLSEGRIAYPVTVRGKGGFITKTIVKEGPTNVILTTTATELHGENETRLLSLPTNDSCEQTKAVMLRLAEGRPREVNVQEWHALQDWLATAEHRVTIPFAGYLAESIPPVAVRLRRDFKALLRLIEAHAILHQYSRARDDGGRIVASPEDYFTVRALVADLVASGVGATVPDSIRATVQAVQRLDLGEGAMVRQVAQELKLDRSAAQRRLQGARERGYLFNLEEKRGRPARYAIGDPLPDEVELLPRALPECAHSTPQTDTDVHNVSPSDAEPFKGGVHLCSDSGEKYREEVIDLAD